jgi:hypothetical protein
MKKAYVLDACALIAVLSKEEGADKAQGGSIKAKRAILPHAYVQLAMLFSHDVCDRRATQYGGQITDKKVRKRVVKAG